MTDRLAGRLAGLVASPAWADHGAGLRSAPMDPASVAVLFGALLLLVAAVVALIFVVVSRRPDPPE
jgi:hypothetical protein